MAAAAATTYSFSRSEEPSALRKWLFAGNTEKSDIVKQFVSDYVFLTPVLGDNNITWGVLGRPMFRPWGMTKFMLLGFDSVKPDTVPSDAWAQSAMESRFGENSAENSDYAKVAW